MLNPRLSGNVIWVSLCFEKVVISSSKIVHNKVVENSFNTFALEMQKSLLIFFLVLSQNCFSQSGIWTWMNGDSIPGDVGHYGIQGIPSSLNHPPSLYEASQWTDLQGNFWLYGGTFNNFPAVGQWIENVLWKYDPTTYEWTWVNGDTIPAQAPVFGIKGIPSITNSPGANCSAATFIDGSGNLWLFGGTNGSILTSNQLWKYDLSTNMWTWMSGDSVYGVSAHYGIQGVPSIINYPSSRHECVSAWSENNNFWVFGGSSFLVGSLNDLWRYNSLTSEWTWMKGDSILSVVPIYGTKGISNQLNDPGGRLCYSHWKDANNNFWLFGGCAATNGAPYFSDMWKYDLSNNEWTWMSGSNLQNDSGIFNDYCNYDSLQYPCSRWENKACWVDSCGTFWMMGGRFNEYLNDLWRFNPNSNQWRLVNGEAVSNSFGNYGVIGVSALSNNCPSRFGAVSWLDQNGNLWLFGGYTPRSSPIHTIGDLWRFTPDSGCSSCNFPFAAFTNNNPSICPGSCTNFFNLSPNANTFQWYFQGGSPDTSPSANPSNICYASPGSYDVTLITSNGTMHDTVTYFNYVHVFPYPSAQSITQNGDTLIAIQGSLNYQWFLNGNVISGATDYSYVALMSGNYNLIATDSNGCEVEAAIFNVMVSSNEHIENLILDIYPNPAHDQLIISCPDCRENFRISVFNLMGILQFQIQDMPLNNFLDVSFLTPGIYIAELSAKEKKYRVRVVKL